MKKSNFTAMILGTISGVLFALGMCMALLPEWDAFREGIVFGAIGLVLGFITLLVWRKMEGKAPIKLNYRNVLFAVFGIVGALVLGLGMCFCLVAVLIAVIIWRVMHSSAKARKEDCLSSLKSRMAL